MSTTYVPQPPTTGKVILITSHGELDIQLWSRECPLACKNFIQLCLEGYYDKTIFHRLIPGFMIQGGDPTGTGTGGQSIYNNPFQDQFHQRLKFSHRGLVAMANEGRNTNRSQFFITFGEANHLNKKHTIFGKVVGNTMFNLLSMQAEQTDQNDRPIILPKILKTKVIINPFDDIKPRSFVNQQQDQSKIKQQNQKNEAQIKEQSKLEMKKLKKKNLLSFQQQQNNESTQAKILSSHDALDDKKLSKKTVITQQQLQWKRKMRELEQQKKEQVKKSVIQQHSEQAANQISQQLKYQLKRKQQEAGKQISVEDDITKFQTRVNLQTGKKEIFWKQDLLEVEQMESESSDDINDEQLKQVREMQKKQFEAIKINELKFKQVQEGSLNPSQKLHRMQQKCLLSNVQKRRMQFLQKRNMQLRQGSMLDKLQDFRKRIKSKNQIQVPNWVSHKLKFHIDSQNAFKHVQKQQNNFDDGGLMVVDSIPQQYKIKRKGMDIDELYRLSKEQN